MPRIRWRRRCAVGPTRSPPRSATARCSSPCGGKVWLRLAPHRSCPAPAAPGRGRPIRRASRPDPRPELRAASYRELLRVYTAEGNVLGQLSQSLVRDWANENVDLRRFASPLAARNLGNDLPDEVVETLLDVCRQKAPVFQRFFRLKAEWLGVERLRRYDLYAPVGEVHRTFRLDEAVHEVLAAFESFEPRVG